MTGFAEDFTGRPGAAVVVGASGGLGAAIARLLAERGSDLALTYRSRAGAADELAAEAAALGRRAKTWQVDLTDAAGVAAFVDAAAEEFGGVHTVVYASGPHIPMVHLSRVSPEQFKYQMDNDAVAFFNLVHPALPHLRAAKGGIVAVTTAATRRFPVRDGLSSAPKGAVEQVAWGLAAEEGRFGVRVNCVGPGMLTDGMAAELIGNGDLDERALDVARGNIPLRRFGVARDIAEAVCFLASDRANFITGQKLDVDGGYGV
ncbi:SDR family NAD(P)-dependent oxidoreductase [Yinghuangia seranimata]|uniref:SDR family NAD(P)-dependent oxidoreductase n=1 Tax=Yinghuangia seranimata TaxID=408067 RepID=UPI00248B41FE|nr:SDR family oxidoreductase [Yinghuangia seranimata]MDI2131472.1 SDR family oxidoreductase [Yinghuangia seranimata]